MENKTQITHTHEDSLMAILKTIRKDFLMLEDGSWDGSSGIQYSLDKLNEGVRILDRMAVRQETEFFNLDRTPERQEYTMLQADLLQYLKRNVEFSCKPIEHNQGWEITYRDEDGCYLSTYNKNQSLTFKTLLA